MAHVRSQSWLALFVLLSARPALAQLESSPAQDWQAAGRAEISSRGLGQGYTLRPADVAYRLRQVIFNERSGTPRSFTDIDANGVTQVFRRTGTGRGGTPVGYVRFTSTSKAPNGIARTTIQTHHHDGTATLRRRFGKDWVFMHQGKDHRLVSSSEHIGGTKRVTHQRTFADGSVQVLSRVRKPDGSGEIYEMQGGAGQWPSERHVRFDSTKRRWRETTKHYDPQAGGLVVVKVDQSGKQRSRVVSDKALQRWQRRFGKARSRTGSQRIRQRGDHSWTWLATPHVSNPYAIGQVKALGKRGLLQRSSSGYVSELGARFGWVNERHAPGKPRQSTNKQVKERGSGLPYSIAGQPAASSGAAGGGASNRARRRLADTVTTIEQLDRASLGAHGIKQINVRVGPDLDRNAGGDINPSNKHKPIRIHPGVAQGSSGLQAFVIGHELGHQKDSKKTFDRRNRAMAVTNAWSAAGLWLPATRAWLRSASLNRSLERTADRSAGRILAKGHATGKTSWTPAAHFPKRAKGQPRRQFSPLDGYDKGPDRARTSWRAFRRTRTR